jgi:hypothetical protein
MTRAILRQELRINWLLSESPWRHKGPHLSGERWAIDGGASIQGDGVAHILWVIALTGCLSKSGGVAELRCWPISLQNKIGNGAAFWSICAGTKDRHLNASLKAHDQSLSENSDDLRRQVKAAVHLQGGHCRLPERQSAS